MISKKDFGGWKFRTFVYYALIFTEFNHDFQDQDQNFGKSPKEIIIVPGVFVWLEINCNLRILP